VDENYKIALCEVNDILENTEQYLVDMIPNSFIKWIKDNRQNNYKTTIVNDIPIEKQILLPETEAFIALLFRKYWSNEEEKEYFIEKDKKEYIYDEEEKRKLYNPEIFNYKQEEKLSKQEEVALIEVKQEVNYFRKIINKIRKIFFSIMN